MPVINARFADGKSVLPTPDSTAPYDARFADGQSVMLAVPTGASGAIDDVSMAGGMSEMSGGING